MKYDTKEHKTLETQISDKYEEEHTIEIKTAGRYDSELNLSNLIKKYKRDLGSFLAVKGIEYLSKYVR